MLRTTLSTLVAASLLVTVCGCVEKTRQLTRTEREQLAALIGTKAPTPQHALDVSLEDKIRLVGYDLSSETWKPGSKLTVTWHWKSEKPIEEGWKLFTHVGDETGATRLNEDGSSAIRKSYQPGQWKAGEYLQDKQVVTLPADWNSPRATFFVGVWKGNQRLRVTQGPSDENRIRALSIPTGAKAVVPKAQPTLSSLRSSKVETPPTLDGKLDEAFWRSATPTAPFVNTGTGGPGAFRVTSRSAWDDDNLYVSFDVADDFLKSSFTKLDEHLWTQDAVEIMLDPDGDGKNYFELQVSPNGVTFDTRYDTRRNPGPIGHASWNSMLKAGVDLKGGKVNDDVADKGYSVEISIPWTAFNAGQPPATKPGAGGATWRMNLYVMDTRKDGSQRAVGWSAPMVGDFHVPKRFGHLRMVDGTTAAAPAPTGATLAMPMLNKLPLNKLPLKAAKALQLPKAENQPAPKVVPDIMEAPKGNGLPVRPEAGEILPTREKPRPNAR